MIFIKTFSEAKAPLVFVTFLIFRWYSSVMLIVYMIRRFLHPKAKYPPVFLLLRYSILSSLFNDETQRSKVLEEMFNASLYGLTQRLS